MKLPLLDELLWAGGFLSCAVLLLVLIVRGRWKQFPVLFAWIAFVTGKTSLCYVVYRFFGSAHLYAQVYWLSMWPEFALQIGVAVELARAAFRRDGKWIGGAGRQLLFWALFSAAAFAALSEWIVPPHGAYASWELRGDLFTSLVVCELLVSIGVIANRLRVRWEGPALALLQALTALDTVCVVVNALQSYFGTRDFRQIEYFQSYAWIGAMIWIAMEFGIARPHAEAPERAADPYSPRAPERNPPGILQAPGTPVPEAVRSLLTRQRGIPKWLSRTLSGTNATDGADA